MAILSAPSILSNGLNTGPMNIDCTISAVLASPVDAIALAAKGPPPAASHVVSSMYNVVRPAWLTPPVMIRSMNSGVPNGKRSIFATGSRSPRDGSSRRDMLSGSPLGGQRSSFADVGVAGPRSLVLDAIRYPSPPAIAGSVLHGALKTLETLESVRDQPG